MVTPEYFCKGAVSSMYPKYMAKLPEIITTSLTLEYDRTADGHEVTTVVAEVPNGVTVRLRVSDNLIYIAELPPSVERELTLLAHPTDRVSVREGSTPLVTTPDVWYSQWSADFYGIIEDVEVEPLHRADVQFDILDVGVGSIYVHPDVREYLPESTLPLCPGDELYVPASPLIVWDLHP